MAHPIGNLRRCQACQLGNHELCTHSTTLGTPQLYRGWKLDVCGCSCHEATEHRDRALWRAKKRADNMWT